MNSLEKENAELKARIERLKGEFPLFDADGLCEQEHHCEFTLLQERKRLHDLLSETAPAVLAAANGDERPHDDLLPWPKSVQLELKIKKEFEKEAKKVMERGFRIE